MVRDRQPHEPTAMLLSTWLAAFCAGVALLLLVPSSKPETATLPLPVGSADPDFQAQRCSQRRTGLVYTVNLVCDHVPQQQVEAERLLDELSRPQARTATTSPARARAQR